MQLTRHRQGTRPPGRSTMGTKVRLRGSQKNKQYDTLIFGESAETHTLRQDGQQRQNAYGLG